MELCGMTSTVKLSFSSDGLPDDDEEEEEIERDMPSTPLADAAVTSNGNSNVGICNGIVNGVNKTIQKVNGTSLVSAKKSSNCAQNKPVSNGSFWQRNDSVVLSNCKGDDSPDAMNQYLDSFCTANDACESEDPSDASDALDFPYCSHLPTSGPRANGNVQNVHETELHKRLHPMSAYQNLSNCCDLGADGNGRNCCRGSCCTLSLQDHSAAARNDMASPDMDFLDFDFDPGPQGAETDSSDEGCPASVPAVYVIRGGTSENSMEDNLNASERCTACDLSEQEVISVQTTLVNHFALPIDDSDVELGHGACGTDETDSSSPNIATSEEIIMDSPLNIANEDTECEINLQSALLNSLRTISNFVEDQSEKSDKCASNEIASNDILDDLNNVDEAPTEKYMIWSELEASNRQITQIGISACGATAVMNVLMALNFPVEKEHVKDCVNTRLRDETAPVAKYLLSRSVAGTMHEDLIACVEQLTQKKICGKFFHFYPKLPKNLYKWLGHWIKLGAVPLATLNPQSGVPPGESVPDAWHHQMIYGVGPMGVYMTNPLECVPVAQIQKQLRSKSILLIRRNDILKRWELDCDLSPLFLDPDDRWQAMNVAGQVINVVRESNAPWIPGYRRHLTSHIKIPAYYQSGIALFFYKDSDVYNELIKSKEI